MALDAQAKTDNELVIRMFAAKHKRQLTPEQITLMCDALISNNIHLNSLDKAQRDVLAAKFGEFSLLEINAMIGGFIDFVKTILPVPAVSINCKNPSISEMLSLWKMVPLERSLAMQDMMDIFGFEAGGNRFVNNPQNTVYITVPCQLEANDEINRALDAATADAVSKFRGGEAKAVKVLVPVTYKGHWELLEVNCHITRAWQGVGVKSASAVLFDPKVNAAVDRPSMQIGGLLNLGRLTSAEGTQPKENSISCGYCVADRCFGLGISAHVADISKVDGAISLHTRIITHIANQKDLEKPEIVSLGQSYFAVSNAAEHVFLIPTSSQPSRMEDPTEHRGVQEAPVRTPKCVESVVATECAQIERVNRLLEVQEPEDFAQLHAQARTVFEQATGRKLACDLGTTSRTASSPASVASVPPKFTRERQDELVEKFLKGKIEDHGKGKAAVTPDEKLADTLQAEEIINFYKP